MRTTRFARDAQHNYNTVGGKNIQKNTASFIGPLVSDKYENRSHVTECSGRR